MLLSTQTHAILVQSAAVIDSRDQHSIYIVVHGRGVVLVDDHFVAAVSVGCHALHEFRQSMAHSVGCRIVQLGGWRI